MLSNYAMMLGGACSAVIFVLLIWLAIHYEYVELPVESFEHFLNTIMLPKSRRRLWKKVQRIRRALKLDTKLKILLGIYQIVTKVDDVYVVNMPQSVRAILAAMSFAIGFGLSSTSAILACIGIRGYLSRLIMWMIAPIAFVLIVLAASACRLAASRNLSRVTLLESALPLILRLLFVLYPIVTSTAFEVPRIRTRASLHESIHKHHVSCAYFLHAAARFSCSCAGVFVPYIRRWRSRCPPCRRFYRVQYASPIWSGGWQD